MDQQTISTDSHTSVLKVQNIPKESSIEAVACWLRLATGHFPAFLCVHETASSLTAVAVFRNCDIDLPSATFFARHNAIQGYSLTLSIMRYPINVRVYSAMGLLTEDLLRSEFPACTEMVLQDCHFARLTICEYAAYLAALEYTASAHVDVRVVSIYYDLEESELHTYSFRADDLLHIAPVATPLQLVAKGVPPESVHVLNEELKNTLAYLHVTSALLVFFNDSVLISCVSEKDYRQVKDHASSDQGLQLCGVRLTVRDLLSDETRNASSCDVLLHNLGEVTKDEVKYFAWALADVPVTKVEFVRERSTKELSALVSFDSPFDIGRLCKGLELIQLSGLTTVAERVRPSWLAIISDLPANVDPSVVVSVLDEARTAVVSCSSTKVPGEWLLTFSSSQGRDAAVEASPFLLRTQSWHNSTVPADGHRTRREVSLSFLRDGYWKHAWQHDGPWIMSLLVECHCEGDRYGEHVTSVLRCSRLREVTNRRQGTDVWADLRYRLSKAFEDRYDCFVLPWPLAAWKLVSKSLRSYEFVRQLKSERGRVAMLEIAPSTACDSCQYRGVYWLAPDTETDRSGQACHRHGRYRVSLSCRCAPSAVLVGLRHSIATLRNLPQLVELLQTGRAASTVCCLPAVAKLLAASGAAMAGDIVSVAVDETRSQVTFIGDAQIVSQSIELFRNPAGPIHHYEVPLSRAVCALLATNRSKTAMLVRRAFEQSLSAKGLSGKLTWMVDFSSHAALVLFASSESVLLAGRCIFEELFGEDSLELPVGCHQSPDDNKATRHKLQKLCVEYQPALAQTEPAAGDFGPCIALVCRRSSTMVLAAALNSCLRQVIVTTAYDLHPVLALWLRRPATAPMLLELQLPTRSMADGRVLNFTASDPASGSDVIVLQGFQTGLETLKSTVASFVCLDQLKVLSLTLRVPGGRRYFTSVEGKRLLDSIIEKTGTMIALLQQGDLNFNNASVMLTDDKASASQVTGSEAQVTCIDAECDDRWCCHWQDVWLVVQRACFSHVDCDAIVVSSGPSSDEAAEYTVTAAAGGSPQVADAQADYPSAAAAATGQSPVTVSVGHDIGYRCKAVLHIAARLPIGQLARPDVVKERLIFFLLRALSTAARLGHRVVALTCFREALGSVDALGAADSAALLVSAVKQVLLNPLLVGQLSSVLLVDESPGFVKLLRSSMQREFADQPRSWLVPPPCMSNGLTVGMSARKPTVIGGQANGPLAQLISLNLQLLDIAVATGIIRSPADVAGLSDAALHAAQTRVATASDRLAATSEARDTSQLLGSIGPLENGRLLATSLRSSAIGALDVLLRPPSTTLQLPSGFIPLQQLSGSQASVRAAGQPSLNTSSATASFDNKRLLDAAGVVVHLQYTSLIEQEADAHVLPINDVEAFRDKFTREYLVHVPLRWPFEAPLTAGSAYGTTAPDRSRCKLFLFAVCTQLGSASPQADYVSKAVQASLFAAERCGISTVAILPFGIGCGTFQPHDAAVLTMNGIKNFCRSRRSSNTFRVIIAVPIFELLQVFETAFAEQLTPDMPYGRGIVSDRWRDQAVQQLMDSTGNTDENRPSETALVICGTEGNILQATALVLERCRAKLKPENLVINDSHELISRLSAEQIRDLTRWASKHADGLELWPERGHLTSGRSVSRIVLKLASMDDDAVSNMAVRLTDILRKEQAALTEENRFVSPAVWQHRFGSFGFWHNYGTAVSLRLEKAHIASESLVTYKNAAGTYAVDLRRMTDTMTENPVNVSAVRRLAITSCEDLPSHWHQSNSYMEVKLRKDIHAQEFSSVANGFASSLGMPHSIVEILRVQNPMLWKQYVVKKEDVLRNLMFQMSAEWELWHGAPAAAVQSICREGFNRSLCGKNGTHFGHGAYFTRSACYAASSQFAVQDSNNVKCMILAKVVVGDFEQGRPDMRVTTYKPYAKIRRRFDSTVNDVVNPAIFVTFHDAQAYPAYVIKFKN